MYYEWHHLACARLQVTEKSTQTHFKNEKISSFSIFISLPSHVPFTSHARTEVLASEEAE